MRVNGRNMSIVHSLQRSLVAAEESTGCRRVRWLQKTMVAAEESVGCRGLLHGCREVCWLQSVSGVLGAHMYSSLLVVYQTWRVQGPLGPVYMASIVVSELTQVGRDDRKGS